MNRNNAARLIQTAYRTYGNNQLYGRSRVMNSENDKNEEIEIPILLPTPTSLPQCNNKIDIITQEDYKEIDLKDSVILPSGNCIKRKDLIDFYKTSKESYPGAKMIDPFTGKNLEDYINYNINKNVNIKNNIKNNIIYNKKGGKKTRRKKRKSSGLKKRITNHKNKTKRKRKERQKTKH